MTSNELREAFAVVKEQLQAREDLVKFVHESLEEELGKVRRSVMREGGADPADLYVSGLIMGLLIKKYLEENVMTAEGVVEAVEDFYGMFFRGLREGGDGGQRVA